MDELTKEIVELRNAYKITFSTVSGQKVLHDLMGKGYFFNSGEGEVSADMPEAIGKRNFVMEILIMLGADDSFKTTEAITKALIALPAYSGEETEDEETEEDL